MISKEQLEHYKRQIIIPEIGEEGQKKLLNSAVLVYGENAESIRPLVYYLAAMGTGKIFCYLENMDGADFLFAETVDLNNDISISLKTRKRLHQQEAVDLNNDVSIDYLSETNTATDCNTDCNIILGSMNFIKKSAGKFLNEKFAPTIVSINSKWKGILQTFDNHHELKNFIDLLNVENNFSECSSVFIANEISSALCAVETVKLCLNIGNIQKDMLFYDLFNMEFSKISNNNILDIIENLKEPNNIDIKQKLSQAKVLIVGVGGLGSPVAYALAMAGVNTIGLLDMDAVEISNLNRQILHSFSRIGMLKVKSAEYMLKKINPNINIITHVTELNKDNAEEIISKYTMVIAAVDNIKTRFLINDTCFLLDKPIAEAGILSFHGTATTIIPKEGHCYRCLYPDINNNAINIENGVLGSVPGVMGFIQAAEAIKIITKAGTTLKNKILLFDGLDMDFNIIEIQKNPNCQTCGVL